MTTPTVRLRRVLNESEHENQRWLVLEGSIDGCPAATKRDTINVAAIASGDIDLEERKAKMRADVLEYYGRVQALAELPTEFD